ncbi:MAG TPA: glycoside hydrolase family 3 N-terminal domain-containing protein [Lacisediminihabitans sp.]|uniref:glycoside hydrolase family 3 protein n=1 Tax=Lacisediminihabitans sp. TaxID=2787631 RepID=UPI002ED8920B
MSTSTHHLFPYQDPAFSVDQRVEDLLARMTLEDKVGLMFQPIAMLGDPDQVLEVLGLPSQSSLIQDGRITHFNVITGAATTGRQFAQWHNALQAIAEHTPLGIPVTISTDPRNAFTDNPAAAAAAGPFSQWPEPIGFGAIGSAATVERFADIARQEYLAAGIRLALHPQIDLATDARWARISGTFGESAELTGRLAAAYIRGFQGTVLGPESVSTMTKHFPGGGAQKDGEDPHFPWGREQVYPGGMFEHHLEPFAAAIDAGTSQIMPYYGMPIGTEYEEVGFGFNKSVITGLLRERFGFDGIVCTDWSIINDSTILGEQVAARAWGVEHLSPSERMVKVLDAGADQFGGESSTEMLLDLVRRHVVDEARVDQSVRRLLREKFVLGLFEGRRVDEDRADRVIGSPEFREAGLQAQRDSLTLLTNASTATGPVLPLTRGITVYIEGIDPDEVLPYAVVTAEPHEADVALLRVKTPFEPRSGMPAQFFHAGSLEFTPEEREHLLDISRIVPTVIDINLERPALLAPLVDAVAAIIADYGASDAALLDVLFGIDEPKGRLPFELPRSMAAIEAANPDAPSDTVHPVFPLGHGLRYGGGEDD